VHAAGAALRFHGSRGRTNRPPHSTLPHVKGGVASFGEVEPRANIEGRGGCQASAVGTPAPAEGVMMSIWPIERSTRRPGASHLPGSPPLPQPPGRGAGRATHPLDRRRGGKGVKERSAPHRMRTAERNDARAGLLMPRTPEIGMTSAGVDRDARGLTGGVSLARGECFVSFLVVFPPPGLGSQPPPRDPRPARGRPMGCKR